MLTKVLLQPALGLSFSMHQDDCIGLKLFGKRRELSAVGMPAETETIYLAFDLLHPPVRAKQHPLRSTLCCMK